MRGGGKTPAQRVRDYLGLLGVEGSEQVAPGSPPCFRRARRTHRGRHDPPDAPSMARPLWRRPVLRRGLSAATDERTTGPWRGRRRAARGARHRCSRRSPSATPSLRRRLRPPTAPSSRPRAHRLTFTERVDPASAPVQLLDEVGQPVAEVGAAGASGEDRSCRQRCLRWPPVSTRSAIGSPRRRTVTSRWRLRVPVRPDRDPAAARRSHDGHVTLR